MKDSKNTKQILNEKTRNKYLKLTVRAIIQHLYCKRYNMIYQVAYTLEFGESSVGRKIGYKSRKGIIFIQYYELW
jgi:hypothetical protein